MTTPISTSLIELTVRQGLLQMHQLALAGQFESDDADALRDQMDVPWQGLSPIERDRIAGLSQDFNAIETITSERPAQPAGPLERTHLVEAFESRKRGDWDKALTLLRQWDRHLPASLASYLRGSIWLEAGILDVAAIFFDNASRLAPDNDTYQARHLQALKRADPAQALTRAERALAQPERCSPAVILRALEILYENALFAP